MSESKKEAISSGGVIIRRDNKKVEVLLIRDTRFENWVLPKGHVEDGETIEQAALREIKEEAGVTSATIKYELGRVRRFVEKANEWKTIVYFLINTSNEQPLGKFESEYTEAKWFSIDCLPNMYLPEQLKIINENMEKIKGS